MVDPDDRHLWVSLGCATENLVLAAAAGLGARRPDLIVRFGAGPLLPRSLRRPVDVLLV